MISASVSRLLDALRQHQLLEPAQLDALSPEGFAESRALARDLLQRGWLSAFQANHLLQGKGGELVLGAYVLLERLGEGGMGTVYKARHRKMQRVVALKVIRKERLADARAVRRFQHEVRAAAQLAHPNVVHAFDADQVGDTQVLVMEYVEGTDLSKLVKQNGPLPVETACEYLRQAALGLQHAHEHGLVHRDIKPSNLLLGRSGEPSRTGAAQGPARLAGPTGVVKLLDLGLARLSEPDGDGEASSCTLTESGAVLGTPDYMAPEQARKSHQVDIRADLYSLGCTFYYLLTGRPPFPGGTLGQKLVQQMMDEPQPLEQLRSDLPAPVIAVIGKLMAKRPEDRYQTPAELAAVLEVGLRTGSWPAPGSEPTSHDREGAEESPSATLPGFSSIMEPPSRAAVDTHRHQRQAAARRRRLWQWTVGGLGALLSLGALGFLLLRDRPQAPPTERGAPQSFVVQSFAVQVAADQPWQDTGVDVVEGQALTLRPVGVWRKGQQACSAAGLEKAPRDRCALPEAPYLCLLARIGDEPEPSVVLPAGKLKAARTGRLYLQANDLDLADNSGSLKVAIDGGVRSDQAAPPPGPTRVETAEAAWKPLREKAKDPKADLEALRKALLEFRTHYGGTPQVVAAGRVLSEVFARLPSPLDKLDAARIPVADLLSVGGGDRQSAPAGLVAILGDTRWRHPAGVNGVAFSPDGKTVAAAGADGIVRLWDVATGRERGFCRGHTAQVHAVVFAPHGRALASVSHDKTIRIWDTATGKELAQGTHTGSVGCVAWSADGGRLASAGYDQTITLWDPARISAGKELASLSTLKGHAAPVWSVAFSPDGKQLLSGAGPGEGRPGELKLWNLTEGKVLLDLPGHKVGRSMAVAFSPNGQLLASGSAEARLWDAASGKELATIPTNHGVQDLSFSPDGKLLAIGDHASGVSLLDVESRKQKHFIPLSAVKPSVAFAPDGQTLATGHSDTGLVQLWDLTGAKPQEKSGHKGHTSYVQSVAFSPDGRLLASGSQDSTVRLWDLSGAAATEVASIPANDAGVSPVAFAADNRTLASGGGDGCVRLWDVRGKTVKERAVVQCGGVVRALAFAPDGGSIAFSRYNDAKVHLWDVTGPQPRERAVLLANSGTVTAVAFSPDGRTLACGGSDPSVGLWQATGKPRKELAVLQGHTAGVGAVAFAPDGQLLASGSNDNTVRLWDLRRSRITERAVLKDHKFMVWSVAFSPDGGTLASADRGGRIILSDPASGKLLRDWQLLAAVKCVAFAPDGRHLAVANATGTVYILRVAPPRAP